MIDSTGVVAATSAASAPEPSTGTRADAAEFLPVLREVSSSGPHRAATPARAGSSSDGQAEPAPGRDEVSGADEAMARREPAPPVPTLDVAALLLVLVPPPALSIETPPAVSPEPSSHGVKASHAMTATLPTASPFPTASPLPTAATLPTSSPDGAAAAGQMMIPPATDVPSIDRPAPANSATAPKAPGVVDPAAVTPGRAPAARPIPAAVMDDGTLRSTAARVPDPAVVSHEGAAAPGAATAPPETAKVSSAAASKGDPATPEVSAVIERLGPIAQEVRGESRAETAIGTTAAADLRPEGVLVREVAAAARPEWTAPEDGGDRGRDGDTARPQTEGSFPIPVGAVESRAAKAVDAPPASELAEAPRPLVDQIAQRVLLISRDGRHEVSMRLEPPELGALRIDAVLAGGQLRLDIRTEGEPTRDLLEQALPRLREALSQHGITADRVTVQVGLDSGPREFSRNGGEPFWPLPQVARGMTPPPRAATAAPVWRQAVTDGFEVWA